MFNPRPSSGIGHSFSKASTKLDVPARIETQPSSSTDQSANLNAHSDGGFGRFGALKDDNLAGSPSFDSKHLDDGHVFNDVKRSNSLGRYNVLDFDIQPVTDTSTIEMPKSVVELSNEGIFDKNYLVQLILTFERLSKFNQKLISEPLRFRFVDISHHTYDKEGENEGPLDKNSNKIKKMIYAKQADSHYRRNYFDRNIKGGHSYYDSGNQSAAQKQAFPIRMIHDSDIMDTTARHDASTLEHANINGLDAYDVRRGGAQMDWKNGDIRGKVDIEFKRPDMEDKDKDPLTAFKEGTNEYSFGKPKLRPMASQNDWKNKGSFEKDIGLFQFSKRFPQKEEAKGSEQSFLEKLLDKPFDNEDDTFPQGFGSPRKNIWSESEPKINLQWQYMDPHGIVHGPFSSEQMHQWYSKNFFPQNLRMRYNTKMSWTPLKDLYPPTTSAFRSLPHGYDGKGDSWPSTGQPWKTPREPVPNFSDREMLRPPQHSQFFGKMHESPKVARDLPKVVAAKTHTSSALPMDILGSLEPKHKPSLHASPFLSMEKPLPKRIPNKAPEMGNRDVLHRGADILKNLEILSTNKDIVTHVPPQTHEHLVDPPRESLGWKKTEVEVASLLEIMEIQKKQSVAAAREGPVKKTVQTGWDFSNNNAHVDLSEDFPTLGTTDVRVTTTRTTKSAFSKQITMPLETFIERNSGVISGLDSNQTFASKVFGK